MNPPKTHQLPGLCTMVLAATIATSLISLEALSAPVTSIDAFFDPNGLEVAPINPVLIGQIGRAYPLTSPRVFTVT